MDVAEIASSLVTLRATHGAQAAALAMIGQNAEAQATLVTALAETADQMQAVAASAAGLGRVVDKTA